MSLVATLYSRFLTPLTYVLRLTVNRVGITPVALAAAALAAGLYHSWRSRRPAPPAPPRRGRRRPRSDNGVPVPTAPEPRQEGEPIPSATRAPLGAFTPSRKPQWLARVRRVTLGAVCSPAQPCHLFSIGAAPDGAADGAAGNSDATKRVVAVLPDAIPHFKTLAAMFELFLVIRVDDDSMEEAVTHAFDKAGLFDSGLMDRRKLVFCETDTGRVSVARQIESQLHVDESFEIVVALQRFLPCVALVSPDARAVAADQLGRNVARFSSLGAMFS